MGIPCFLPLDGAMYSSPSSEKIQRIREETSKRMYIFVGRYLMERNCCLLVGS